MKNVYKFCLIESQILKQRKNDKTDTFKAFG